MAVLLLDRPALLILGSALISAARALPWMARSDKEMARKLAISGYAVMGT